MKFFRFLLLFLLAGCFDLFIPTKKIPGSYYLSQSESGTFWTLYYDLDGAGHLRVDTVNKIGWTNKYIFAEGNNNYYFLDKTKDEGVLNADEIVIGPLGHDKFLNMLDSLRIKDFTFQMYLDK